MKIKTLAELNDFIEKFYEQHQTIDEDFIRFHGEQNILYFIIETSDLNQDKLIEKGVGMKQLISIGQIVYTVRTTIRDKKVFHLSTLPGITKKPTKHSILSHFTITENETQDNIIAWDHFKTCGQIHSKVSIYTTKEEIIENIQNILK